MAENMMNSEHKATNEKYRKYYDEVKWNRPKKDKKDDRD